MSDNNWLKDHLTKIENKIDGLDGRIDSVDVTLAKQSVVLEEHQRRSLANEEQVQLLKKHLDIEIEPIKLHVNQVHLILKLIGLVASVVAAMAGFFELLQFIKI